MLVTLGLGGCAEPVPSRRDLEAEANCSEPLRRAITFAAVHDAVEMRDMSPFLDASPKDEIQWAKAYGWPLCMARAGFRCEGGVGPGIPSSPGPPGVDLIREQIDRPSATCSRDSGSFTNPFGRGLKLR